MMRLYLLFTAVIIFNTGFSQEQEKPGKDQVKVEIIEKRSAGVVVNRYQVIAGSGDPETGIGAIKHGTYEKWFRNGNKRVVTTYRYGDVHGKLTTWYENGNVKESAFYDMGKPHGNFKVYYPNGNLYMEGQYDHGEKVGTWKGYDKEGNKLTEKTYKKE